jgi:LacI family transcriptional regulator
MRVGSNIVHYGPFSEIGDLANGELIPDATAMAETYHTFGVTVNVHGPNILVVRVQSAIFFDICALVASPRPSSDRYGTRTPGCAIRKDDSVQMSAPGDQHEPASPPGIKDIARALGVSIGTVDRALHDRPGINPMTRAKVLKMAQTLGYQPNFAARHLKLKRRMRISVHLPRSIASFFDAVREGIQEAARPFQSTIEVQFRTYPRLGEGDLELFTETLRDGTSGIIVTPGHPADLKPWIRKAARAHIPVVCVATDAPGTERLATISADAFTSGAMVAELLAGFANPQASVLIVTGDLSVVDHAEKVDGFRSFVEKTNTPLQVASVIEAHDDPEKARELTRAFMATHPKIGAVYVSTANSIPVIEALQEAGRLGRIPVITTDLFPALAPLIREGKVLATIYQRPKTQGRMAFEALYQFLVQGACPALRHRLPPHIVLRSNLDLFLEMMPADRDDAASETQEFWQAATAEPPACRSETR